MLKLLKLEGHACSQSPWRFNEAGVRSVLWGRRTRERRDLLWGKGQGAGDLMRRLFNTFAQKPAYARFYPIPRAHPAGVRPRIPSAFMPNLRTPLSPDPWPRLPANEPPPPHTHACLGVCASFPRSYPSATVEPPPRASLRFRLSSAEGGCPILGLSFMLFSSVWIPALKPCARVQVRRDSERAGLGSCGALIPQQSLVCLCLGLCS